MLELMVVSPCGIVCSRERLEICAVVFIGVRLTDLFRCNRRRVDDVGEGRRCAGVRGEAGLAEGIVKALHARVTPEQMAIC